VGGPQAHRTTVKEKAYRFTRGCFEEGRGALLGAGTGHDGMPRFDVILKGDGDKQAAEPAFAADEF